MKVRKRSLLYTLLFPIVWLAAKVFYRKFKVEGKENFPKDGPVIVVSNHQNGLMDPVMCCLSSPRQLHFLTRADVFKKPFIRAIITRLNMMPVYRPHDRVENMTEKNEFIFNHCIERLEKGACIALFPEGNHSNKYTIRPMKKGLARMVYRSIEKNPELANIKIVAMGIHYSDYTDFREDFTIRISEPIDLKDWLTEHPNSPSNQKLLMDKVKTKLETVALHIAPKNYYDYLYTFAKHMENKGEDWHLIKSRVDEYPCMYDTLKEEDQISMWTSATAAISSHKIQWKDMSAGREPDFWSWARIVALAPLAALGYLVFALPCFLTQRIVSKNIKDSHFTSSFKMVFGLLLLPTFALLYGLLVGYLFGWIAFVIFMIAAVLSGLVALKHHDYAEEIRGNNRRTQIRKSHPHVILEFYNWVESMNKAIIKKNHEKI
ncbi:MAG: lysophospholipid acyltransferase family protein [Flavobacteriales bacterium]